MDHISTDAATAQDPTLILRSRRHTPLGSTDAQPGVTDRELPRDEIPAQVGGYLSVYSLSRDPHGSRRTAGHPRPHSGQRREHR